MHLYLLSIRLIHSEVCYVCRACYLVYYMSVLSLMLATVTQHNQTQYV